MPLINQYQNIFDRVVEETNRPDLQAEINLAISNAAIHFHNIDDWPYDVVSVTPTYTLNQDTQTVSIDKCDQLPRYKKLALTRSHCAGSVTGVYINGRSCPATDNTTNFANRRCSIGFYEDALFLSIKTGFVTSSDVIEIDYYQHPLLSPITSLDSWIASMYPQYLWTYAARQVLRAIGNNQQAVTLGEELAAFENNLLSMHLPDQS